MAAVAVRTVRNNHWPPLAVGALPGSQPRVPFGPGPAGSWPAGRGARTAGAGPGGRPGAGEGRAGWRRDGQRSRGRDGGGRRPAPPRPGAGEAGARLARAEAEGAGAGDARLGPGAEGGGGTSPGATSRPGATPEPKTIPVVQPRMPGARGPALTEVRRAGGTGVAGSGWVRAAGSTFLMKAPPIPGAPGTRADVHSTAAPPPQTIHAGPRAAERGGGASP